MKKLTVNQYAKILFETTHDLKGDVLDQAVSAFVEFVRKNQAWKRMSEILGAFQKYAKKQEGWVELNVTSAHALSGTIIEDIKKHFGGKAEVTVAEDKELIGGIKVQTDNKIFDASVKTQLQKLQHYL